MQLLPANSHLYFSLLFKFLSHDLTFPFATLHLKVFVCEPTIAETIEVLRGLKDNFQNYHSVQILDEALTAAASIAAQFFAHKRFVTFYAHMLLRRLFLFPFFNRLPDAAIDLVDEACVSVKIGNNESWEQLGQLKRRKVAIEMVIRSLEVSPTTLHTLISHHLVCS